MLVCNGAMQVVRLKASVGANSGQVTVRAAAPSATVTLSPLAPRRVCSTPLAVELLEALQQGRRAPITDQSLPCASMQHGVLTLDQGRSLVPLHAAEAQVRSRMQQAGSAISVWARFCKLLAAGAFP